MPARLAVKVNSEIGRTEYLLVSLVEGTEEGASLSAYPMGQGSGSVTSFSRADGLNLDRKQALLGAFFAIERAAG